VPSQLWCTYNAQDIDTRPQGRSGFRFATPLILAASCLTALALVLVGPAFMAIRQLPDDGRVWRGYCPKRQRSGIDAEGS
jgi:hypothetical protein